MKKINWDKLRTVYVVSKQRDVTFCFSFWNNSNKYELFLKEPPKVPFMAIYIFAWLKMVSFT